MKTRFSITATLLAVLLLSSTRLPAQADPGVNQPLSDQNAPRPPRPPRPPDLDRSGPPPDAGARSFRGTAGPGLSRLPDGGYGNPAGRGNMEEQFFAMSMGRMESRTLVVATAKLDAAVVAALEEDLPVMARILDKSLANELGQPSISAMGIPMIARGNSRVAQSLYLGGYGVLFQIGVAFPLMPPADRPRQDEAPKPAISPWEEAHREIFGSRDRPDGWENPSPFGQRREEYQPERVEALKKNLLEALKSASNIRNLKPDEFITVMVTGGDNRTNWRPGRRMPAGRTRSFSPGGEGGEEGHREGRGDAELFEPAVVHQAVLTITVRRADVEQLAQGKTSPEDFRRKAAIHLD